MWNSENLELQKCNVTVLQHHKQGNKTTNRTVISFGFEFACSAELSCDWSQNNQQFLKYFRHSQFSEFSCKNHDCWKCFLKCACMVPENTHTSPKDDSSVQTFPPVLNFQFCVIRSLKNFGFLDPLPLVISNDYPFGEYGYFLEPHDLFVITWWKTTLHEYTKNPNQIAWWQWLSSIFCSTHIDHI